MPFELKLPDIGEGIAEGEIVRWLVKPGERVAEGQPLVEVMTDKASVEIPAPRSGVIAALLAEAGQVVPVGTAIVSIAVDGESPAAAGAARPAARATPAPRAAPAAATAPASATAAGAAVPVAAARVPAAPAVRLLAKELGVALEGIAGSGPGGAVTAADVRRAAEATRGAVPGSAPAAAAAEPEERVPVRGLRRLIAEHMKRSIQTAAHFTFVAECDFTPLPHHRTRTRA